MAAVPLFPVQLVGDLMKAVCYAIQLPMLPQERFRARNIMTFAQYAVFAGVFFGVPAGERLWGAVWGHTASWACLLAILLIYLHRVNRFRFSAENLRLLVGSFAAVLAVAVLPFPSVRMRFVGLAIAVVWAATSITRREVERLLDVLRARMQSAGSDGNG